jgi:MFS family permease
MFGMYEAQLGVGQIAGPLIGGIIYSLGGYNFLFYFFGVIFFILSVSIKLFFGEEVDYCVEKESKDNKSYEENVQKPTVRYMDLFKNTQFTISLMSSILGQFVYEFPFAILSIDLKQNHSFT